MIKTRYFYTPVIGVALLVAISSSSAETAHWSDTKYWGGRLPSEGSDVVIPEGDTVYLDVSPPALGNVEIAGSLIFRDQDLSLSASTIYVSKGLLQVGTKEVPFTSHAEITINGPKESMSFGHHKSDGRHLVVGMGGTLELHGASSTQAPTWVQLSNHVLPGDTSLKLSTVVKWNKGDKIVLAPSGYKASEVEEFEVAGVGNDGKTVFLTSAAQFKHFGQIIRTAATSIDMRAEVGLLTRNIVIQSPESTNNPDSSDYQFGFHSMFLHGSTIHVEGVELVRGGQTGLKARYPFHWHHAHDAQGDYFTKSSIHHSHQRGVVVHRTQNTVVHENVLYHIKDHGIVFSEDGDETGNSFHKNLVMDLKLKEREEFAFPIPGHFGSSQAEIRPSGFWGRNYHNTFTENHIAGIYYGLGFFFDDIAMPVERELITTPYSALIFKNNTVHTIERVESKVYYGPQASGHALMVGRYGAYHEKPGLGNGPIVFDSLTAYKIDGFGAWVESEKHTVDNGLFVQTSVGVFNRRSAVRNTTIIQNTENDIGGTTSSLNKGNQRTGYGIVVKNGTPASYPYLENNTFVSIPRAAIGVIKGGLQKLDAPFQMVVKGSTLIDTLYPVDIQLPTGIHNGIPERFTVKGEPTTFPYSIPKADGVLLDADGSLKGDGVPGYFSYNALPSTVGNSEFYWSAEEVRKKRDGTQYRLMGVYFHTPLEQLINVEPTPVPEQETEKPVEDSKESFTSELSEIQDNLLNIIQLFKERESKRGKAYSIENDDLNTFRQLCATAKDKTIKLRRTARHSGRRARTSLRRVIQYINVGIKLEKRSHTRTFRAIKKASLRLPDSL